jgi:hypothetical protein
MLSTEEFATQDMKSIVHKILKIMDFGSDTEDSSVNHSHSFTQILKSPTRSTKKSHISSPKFSPKWGSSMHSTTPTPSSPKFGTTYARMLAFQKRQDQDLKKMHDKKEENLRLTHTHTPILNEKSRKLTGNINPIYSRYQQELIIKEKRRKDMATKIHAIKEEKLKKELTFKPVTIRSTSSIRSSEEYYNYMKKWKENKELIDKKERDIKEEKALEGVTFKPNLNKQSANMSKNLPNFETRLERGIQRRDAKIKEKKSISPCSFKPELKTNYKKTEMTPVFDRLYQKHSKTISSSTARTRSDI